MDFLDFEMPILQIEKQIEELKLTAANSESSDELDQEINNLCRKHETLTKEIFSNLSEWQIAQLARHPERPKALDVIHSIVPDFKELHGDRMYADDTAIVAGLGTISNLSLLFIAQEKGQDTKSRIFRNYGMPRLRLAICCTNGWAWLLCDR